MSAAFRASIIKNHPNRSRLEAAEKEAAHRAANPPPFNGPQDFDNPLAFLTAYDHVSPVMRVGSALNLPSYNKMILTPSEQADLQQAFGDLKNLLLNRVLPLKEAESAEKAPELLKRAPQVERTAQPAEQTTTRPNPFTVNPGAASSYPNPFVRSAKAQGKQPQRIEHIDLEDVPTNSRRELDGDSPAAKGLRATYTGKNLKRSSGPHGKNIFGNPASKRVKFGDELGSSDQDEEAVSPEVISLSDGFKGLPIETAGPSGTTSLPAPRKIRRSNGEDDPLYKPVSPDLAQEAADDALVPDVNDLTTKNTTSAPRKSHKVVDPTYHPFEDEEDARMQEAADEALMGDLNIDKSRFRYDLVDPTHRYTQGNKTHADAISPESDSAQSTERMMAEMRRRIERLTDSTYHYVQPDSAQEAADDALRPDFNDLHPSKPGRITDLTFLPNEEDDEDLDPEFNYVDLFSPARTKQPKKTTFTQTMPKKIVTFASPTEKENSRAGMDTPQNTPIAPSPGKSLSAKMLAKKASMLKKTSLAESAIDQILQAWSDNDSEESEEDDQEEVAPEKPAPKKKPAAKKATPKKKAAPKPVPEPEPQSESDSEQENEEEQEQHEEDEEGAKKENKNPAPKKATPKKKAPAKKVATPEKAPAKKAAPMKTPVKKATPAKKATPKKATPKRSLAAEEAVPLRRSPRNAKKS